MKLLFSYLTSKRAWKSLLRMKPGLAWYTVKSLLYGTFFPHKPLTIENAVKGDYQQFLKDVKTRKSPAFFEEFVAREFYRLNEEAKQNIIRTADDVSSHVFRFLGSGRTHLGDDINWHQDFKYGKIWPNIPIANISYAYWYEGSDIKVPWELSRFQYVSTLGYAWWLTGDEKYAKTFVDLVEDWIAKNKVGYGINWKNAMEVAIRLCNWIAGWYFFRRSQRWTEEFSKIFFASVADHGNFIIHNLEVGPTPSNHYLADVVGLLFAGVMFPELKGADKWKKKALKALEEEMRRQVYEDGVDYEASIPYHRLVTELFAFSALLCKVNTIMLSDSFWRKLEKMFEFVRFYTKPNGFAPQIGDNDDGRLFIFEGDYVSWERRDHRHLLRLAEELFPERTEFRDVGLPYGNLTSKSFPEGGFYIMRSKDVYCIIECGQNGQGGNGGHAHNDALSFELNILGRDFIVDPGSYVYTSDPGERNRFRSTRMHNTVFVDEEEMNRFLPETLFALRNDTVVTVNKWETNAAYDYLDASHSAYERLENPVTHRRVITLDKRQELLEVTDIFYGRGAHVFEWNFHFDPAVRVTERSLSIVELTNGDSVLIMEFPQEVTPHSYESEYSPSYGVKVPARAIYARYRGEAGERQFTFRFSIKNSFAPREARVQE